MLEVKFTLRMSRRLLTSYPIVWLCPDRVLAEPVRCCCGQREIAQLLHLGLHSLKHDNVAVVRNVGGSELDVRRVANPDGFRAQNREIHNKQFDGDSSGLIPLI